VADLDLYISWEGIPQLLIAVVLALPTAWHRETHSRIMGLRTFPLVALGACAYVLIGMAFIGPDSPDAMARIMQGLLTGVGFVGGGAILKYDDHVQGTASASSIWIMGALGAAVGFKVWGLALALSGLNFLLVWVMSYLKQPVPTDKEDS
jgi:putative Mg2+ transporter-C (MgtC) family protein